MEGVLTDEAKDAGEITVADDLWEVTDLLFGGKDLPDYVTSDPVDQPITQEAETATLLD